MQALSSCQRDSSVGKVLTTQARGPEFDAQHSSMVVHACNPSPGEMQIHGVHLPVSQAESGNFRSSRRDKLKEQDVGILRNDTED